MRVLVLILLFAIAAGCLGCAGAPSVDWCAADVATLRSALDAGKLSSETLVQACLERIAAIDEDGPRLNAVLAVNPRALDEARERDSEPAKGAARGPLHGIPVLLKGNIDIAGIENTAGSPALAGNIPAEDAPLVARLRDEGAVILGTANLSEWANFRSSHSSSGWSSLGRQTKNPYALDRNPCGSSSGSAVAVAAGITVVAVGTETDGSVVCPAGQNGVVGIKPTLGLVSGDGIIPIAHSQDTAGPMGRTVRDAALTLQALARADTTGDFAAALVDGARLEGVRLGVWRGFYGAGVDAGVEACLDEAIAALWRIGAVVVDPVDLGELEGLDGAELTVLNTEFKHDLAAYLDTHGSPNGMTSLEDLIAYNEEHRDVVMPYFGQERFEAAQAAGPLDDEEYLTALADSKRIAQGAIDDALEREKIVALIAPTNSPAWPIDLANGDHYVLSSSQLPAVSGYPNITVPMCYVHELPVGLSIFGGAFTEGELIRIAHAFEGATTARKAPEFAPTLTFD